MRTFTDPDDRTAVAPDENHTGRVTLINSFVVAPDRDSVFLECWHEISGFMRGQPGFRWLRLHRALSPDADYRYVNVAEWDSAEQFAAAHATADFRSMVSAPAMREFPSSPALYEVTYAHGDAAR